MKNNSTIIKVLFIVILLGTLTPYVSAPMALVAGFLFANIAHNPFPQFSSKATSWLLKASVVGLGFGMNIGSAMEVGRDGFMLTACSITIVLTLGFVFGSMMKIPRKLSHLIASGTSICGGSAIAAVAPAVKANPSEVSMSLGVIFFLNSIALLLFPVLGHIVGMDQHQFGMWCAMAIHDTSSVVGAASAYGEEALMVATTVKLARALWIIPVSLLSIALFKSGTKKISIPWFIFLFIGAMLVNSFTPNFAEVGSVIFHLSKSLLVATLFLIGASLSVKSMREVGIKPLILGVSLWVVISILSLSAILIIY